MTLLKPYTRRGAPAASPQAGLAGIASTLKGYLDVEFANVQRGIPGAIAAVFNPYAVIPGERNVVSQLYPVGDVRRYGAACDGVTDDTTSVRNAISGQPGTAVTITVPGFCRLTGDLSDVINAKRSVTIQGVNGQAFRGLAFPPYPVQSALYLKELTDYLVTRAGSTLEMLLFQNIGIDFSNGGGTVNGSLTAPGVLATNGVTTYNVTVRNVVCTDTKYTHSAITGPTGRAVWDLDASVVTTFDGGYMGFCENGRLWFTDGGSTEFYAHRIWMQGVREAYYHRDTYNVQYDECVFESSLAIGASYLTNLTHTNCYYENLGINTGTAAWTAGLTPRDHGLTFGGGILTGGIDTAINQLYGSVDLRNSTFQGLHAGGLLTAWLECLGAPNTPGSGGSLSVSTPRKTDATLADLLFKSTMAFGTAERGTNFSVAFDDAWGANPVGSVIRKCDDARVVNDGRARIEMNDGSFQLARIERGNFVYAIQDPASSASVGLATWPRNGQNIVGDRLIVPTPVSGGFIGYVCTTAGTPGTWKAFGIIS